MQAQHSRTQRIIEVSSEHYESVLKSQGWMEYKQPLNLEPSREDENSTVEKLNRGRGRPKKVSNVL